jgi:hypothetical protein
LIYLSFLLIIHVLHSFFFLLLFLLLLLLLPRIEPLCLVQGVIADLIIFRSPNISASCMYCVYLSGSMFFF